MAGDCHRGSRWQGSLAWLWVSRVWGSAGPAPAAVGPCRAQCSEGLHSPRHRPGAGFRLFMPLRQGQVCRERENLQLSQVNTFRKKRHIFRACRRCCRAGVGQLGSLPAGARRCFGTSHLAEPPLMGMGQALGDTSGCFCSVPEGQCSAGSTATVPSCSAGSGTGTRGREPRPCRARQLSPAGRRASVAPTGQLASRAAGGGPGWAASVEKCRLVRSKMFCRNALALTKICCERKIGDVGGSFPDKVKTFSLNLFRAEHFNFPLQPDISFQFCTKNVNKIKIWN